MIGSPAVTAVDTVAAGLRRQILAGDPAPGGRLREEVLAADFQVSRHTLRAALRALAAEHLVVVEPNRGARVATVDGAQLAALIELRTALEVEAVRLLAERRGLEPWPAEVTRAAGHLEASCSPGAAADRSAVDDAHAALHHALVAAAGSDRITAAHAALAGEGRIVLLQSRDSLPVERMVLAHRELLARLRRQGPDALREHLLEGRDAARRA